MVCIHVHSVHIDLELPNYEMMVFVEEENLENGRDLGWGEG